MKKVYKLGNCYFNIDRITKITKPIINEEINENLKDEFVETITKNQKCITIFIDGKEYRCTNYWDSDYNVGITKETDSNYEEYKTEALNLFEAFINK